MKEIEMKTPQSPSPSVVDGFESTRQAGDQITALLDQGASFEGLLTFEGTVRIGGRFKGEIFTQDTLVIDAGAEVEAQIEAGTVIISGTVKGNVFARRGIVMHPPAILRGTVTTPRLQIDEGVVFEGASQMPVS